MNTGQSILTIGALALFSFIIISFGNLQSNYTSVSLLNESIVTGSGICQSMIDEISAKSFDEGTVSGAIADSEGLTSPVSLGPDAGESSSAQYDDVDDYNNHTRTVSSERLGDFNVSVSVFYVNFDAPETENASTSFVKKINVIVTSDLIEGNIKQTSVMSY